MYLLDTNVISELRRPRPHGGVAAWVQSVPSAYLNISAATFGEIQASIERTRRNDKAKAQEIEAWLNTIAKPYVVLSMNAETFQIWAELIYNKTSSFSEKYKAMIAAIAIQHDLTVVTRNVDDFAAFSVPVFNPFEYK